MINYCKNSSHAVDTLHGVNKKRKIGWVHSVQRDSITHVHVRYLHPDWDTVLFTHSPSRTTLLTRSSPHSQTEYCACKRYIQAMLLSLQACTYHTWYCSTLFIHQAQAILEIHAEQKKLEKEEFPGCYFCSQLPSLHEISSMVIL